MFALALLTYQIKSNQRLFEIGVVRAVSSIGRVTLTRVNNVQVNYKLDAYS